VSGKDDSEERNLPPSDKKLREGREKGQVAQSKDMVAAVGTTVAFVYLLLQASPIRDSMAALFAIAGDNVNSPVDHALAAAGPALLGLAAQTILPLVLIVLLTSVVANVIVLKGFIFAFDPLIPQFDKINPTQGFERIVSTRNLVEFIKSLTKTLILGSIVIGLVVLTLDDVLKAPRCGIGCLGAVFGEMFRAVAVAASGVFLASGILDLGLQQWLFRRDMRMTRTEAKRERKDMDGDPHIRNERRRQRKEWLLSDQKIGLHHATLVIADPGRSDVAVAIRYVRGETPVPVIVAKARGIRASLLCERAHGQRTAVADDGDLALTLVRCGAALGDYIPQPLFGPVAQAIVRTCGIP
jgi:type III secretion protein U